MGRSEVRSSVGAEDKFFSSDFFGGVGRGGGGGYGIRLIRGHSSVTTAQLDSSTS